ncbi:MAG: hypothetical protein ABIP64_17295 [Burkholderiales bacterium]
MNYKPSIYFYEYSDLNEMGADFLATIAVHAVNSVFLGFDV